MFKFVQVFFLLVFAVLNSDAKIVMSGLFADHMVLQQQALVGIWGKGKANTEIILITFWNQTKYTTKTDKDGSWRLKISTPKAGGPFDITISDGDKITLKDVLIGEVWVCSGQSNMEMPLRGNSSPILNAAEIILNADNTSLRLFRVPRATTLQPVQEFKGSWLQSNSETAREFSALAFQYGQILQKKLNVPVGLILSTVGGTMIQSWMDAAALREFPEVVIPVKIDSANKAYRLPTTLYNGMIAPVAGYGIRGFIWMQGESNRHEPTLYAKLFPAMVKQWRNAWDMGELPFYYVQIAPYNSIDKKLGGPMLREAQLLSMASIPNSGMVCAMDVGMEKDIHFMDKTALAQRLSYWALGKTYAIKGVEYQSPTFSSMKLDGNKAILTFDNAPYLTSYKKPITQFEIAGSDHKFYPAKAEILANKITVSSDYVKMPIAVRYAFKEWAIAEIFNNNGIPASSFRTDNWDN